MKYKEDNLEVLFPKYKVKICNLVFGKHQILLAENNFCVMKCVCTNVDEKAEQLVK